MFSMAPTELPTSMIVDVREQSPKYVVIVTADEAITVILDPSNEIVVVVVATGTQDTTT